MQDIIKRQKELFKLLPRLNSYVIHIQKQGDMGLQKKGEIDIVTAADTGSEKLLTDFIRSNFPADSVLGEESGSYIGTNSYRWIIDPIDGTTNFANGLPLYSISVAIENIDSKEVLMGLVSLPAFSEVYHSIKGEGAYKNSVPIRVSESSRLIDSLLCTGFPYKVKEKPESILKTFTHLLLRSRGIRRTGSACLDLCWLAEGRFDGFWEEDLNPWDTAAASLIVQEAGGVLSDFSGANYNPYKKTILAANPSLHRLLLDEIQKTL